MKIKIKNNKKDMLGKKGFYLLPNIFTTASLFAGFYAIVQAMNGAFDHSAIAIFIALILDGLDGRVARLTDTESDFGAEYDSLSDMVSFGAAPALVIYVWALNPLGKFGWIIAFIYCACAAFRLARFNVKLDIENKKYFSGLPSPAAANHCIWKKPKKISSPLIPLSKDIQMKLASNVAAAGDGKPEKYFLFSMSNFTLKRANLNAAHSQYIKAIIQPNFPKGFNAHT